MSSAIIIGGGFYGAAIALYLKQSRKFESVKVFEQNSAILLRASYNNQARVHNGFHYPRSFTTAYRSRVNFPRFVEDFSYAIGKDFTKLYAIARRNSKVTAKQFVRFCKDIGAKIENPPVELKKLFDPRLIEEVFLVEEVAFNSKKIANQLFNELATSKIALMPETTVAEIVKAPSGLRVLYQAGGEFKEETAKFVFNCTYSGLNQIGGDFKGIATPIKHEITEMGLVKMPSNLANIGVTVMDGPFFSIMPFPARNLHTVSHVRYTPHLSWLDARGMNPYERLREYSKESRVDRMLRDISSYMPDISHCQVEDSLFEVKTVLVKNESDDGRPIFFERHLELPGCYSILGGKIDNIYDVLEKLDSEPLTS